ncbi:MAG: sigma-70 family RNA polymerase sigma factor [Ktedonobacteraceae bacterium]|nr:sigma-70 family RNA polymerase sigma factor [Ktedonobacteraceae bacterium]
MSISMEESPCEMSLTSLADRSFVEMSKYRRKEASDDRYCLEIMRRAVLQNDDEAWAVLYRQFGENLHLWFHRHPWKDVVLQYEQEEHYVDLAFERFWKSVRKQELSFSTLAAAMSYLHMCLNCSIMDMLRDSARPKEAVLPDYEQANEAEPLVEDMYHENDVWEAIESLLPDDKEKRVAYLHFHCNLKAREIMQFCPGEFCNEREIYRLKRNIIDRLVRNKDKFLWRLGGCES